MFQGLACNVFRRNGRMGFLSASVLGKIQKRKEKILAEIIPSKVKVRNVTTRSTCNKLYTGAGQGFTGFKDSASVSRSRWIRRSVQMRFLWGEGGGEAKPRRRTGMRAYSIMWNSGSERRMAGSRRDWRVRTPHENIEDAGILEVYCRLGLL